MKGFTFWSCFMDNVLDWWMLFYAVIMPMDFNSFFNIDNCMLFLLLCLVLLDEPPLDQDSGEAAYTFSKYLIKIIMCHFIAGYWIWKIVTSLKLSKKWRAGSVSQNLFLMPFIHSYKRKPASLKVSTQPWAEGKKARESISLFRPLVSALLGSMHIAFLQGFFPLIVWFESSAAILSWVSFSFSLSPLSLSYNFKAISVFCNILLFTIQGSRNLHLLKKICPEFRLDLEERGKKKGRTVITTIQLGTQTWEVLETPRMNFIAL